MQTGPIVVVGSINLDLVLHTDRIPLSGETLLATGCDESLGGKGANQAVAAAKLGGKVSMIGRIGSDAYGERLRAGMLKAGVDLSATERVTGSSGIALIVHAANGANTIVVVPGANAMLDQSAVNQYALQIEQASILMLQLETPIESAILAAQIATDSGVPVILDPAPACEIPSALLRSITWITPNETEAATLLHGSSDESTQNIAQRLLDLGAANVALKLGEKGVFLSGRDCPLPVLIPAFSVDAVDTTAAGDCFNAAFAIRLVQGDPPEKAARYACAAAAISVTRAGAQSSMPEALEVERLLSSD